MVLPFILQGIGGKVFLFRMNNSTGSCALAPECWLHSLEKSFNFKSNRYRRVASNPGRWLAPNTRSANTYSACRLLHESKLLNISCLSSGDFWTHQGTDGDRMRDLVPGSDATESPSTLICIIPIHFFFFFIYFLFITHINNLQTGFWTLCTCSNHQARQPSYRDGLWNVCSVVPYKAYFGDHFFPPDSLAWK